MNMTKRKMSAPRKIIRYAVVGLGHIAQAAVLPAFGHARANSVLSALVSGDEVKLSKLSSRYGVEHTYTYDQYDECLRSGFVDAVYLTLPNHLHKQYAIAALREGIHVLCEKPLGLTATECKAMIRSSARRRAKLMVAYRLHFDDAHLNLMRLVQSGRLGDVRIIQSLFTQQVRKGDTRLDPKVGGGPLPDIGIYCINAARYFFQAEPSEAFAMQLSNNDARFRRVEEMDGVCLRFPGERLASFICSFGASNRVDVDIVGTKGNARLESAYKYSADMRQITQIGERITTRRYPVHDQFAPQLKYFTDCILKDKEPEPSGLEGLIDVAIIEALQRSARSGKPVTVRVPSKRNRPSPHQGMRIARPRVPSRVRVKSPTR
ncbi:Gfo/Idh/MocA family protein [Candidatus Nitrospira nitrificans]|uniref:Putative glucose-fructose oxidoreductase oxidoreductase protein n=1 Tax=Candidatus Nitrospira nitrificans TaxID=1742973 RepID=A0A0S4LSY6_9BACT|nr:Gfo/Idh/MocA family oxidoreductase [Candidatus Nitrospira nitrificans]CUS39805.1 putative glucose-fructose oxidoreductase oxidoreductase protein [Candidatus Nitrospira nitrificans]